VVQGVGGAIFTDVILLTEGQSNEAGESLSGQPVDNALDQDASGRILQWKPGASSAIPAVQPMVWADGGGNGPTPGFATAQRLLPLVDASKKIIIITAAAGGTKLYQSVWAAPSGARYVPARDALASCLAAYPGALVIIDTTQGEQDGNDSVPAELYRAAYSAKLAGYRAVSGAGNAINLIHQMVPENFLTDPAVNPGRRAIDHAHKRLALSDDKVIFVGSTLGYQISGDPAHFVSAGSRLAGNRGARAHTWAQGFGIVVPPVPAIPVNLGASKIRITATNPPAPAYVVERRAAGTSDAWLGITVYPPLWCEPGETFDIYLHAAGNTEVRVKSKCFLGESAASSVLTMTLPWYLTRALVDADEQNSRWYVGGVEYASKAAMVTAGVLTQTGGIDRYPITVPDEYLAVGKGVTSATIIGATPRYMFALDDGNDAAPTDELIYIGQALTGTACITGAAFKAGTVLTPTTTPGPFFSSSGSGQSQAVRAGISVASQDFGFASNGGSLALGYGTGIGLPVVTQLVIGNREDGARPWGGTLNRVALVQGPIYDGDQAVILA